MLECFMRLQFLQVHCSCSEWQARCGAKRRLPLPQQSDSDSSSSRGAANKQPQQRSCTAEEVAAAADESERERSQKAAAGGRGSGSGRSACITAAAAHCLSCTPLTRSCSSLQPFESLLSSPLLCSSLPLLRHVCGRRIECSGSWQRQQREQFSTARLPPLPPSRHPDWLDHQQLSTRSLSA